MEKAEDFLIKAVSLLCSALYKMCKNALSKEGGDRANDPKFLKEVGAALKEASGILAGLEKKKPADAQGIKIVFGTDGGEQ